MPVLESLVEGGGTEVSYPAPQVTSSKRALPHRTIDARRPLASRGRRRARNDERRANHRTPFLRSLPVALHHTRDETRTRISRRMGDFESPASTDSATRATFHQSMLRGGRSAT